MTDSFTRCCRRTWLEGWRWWRALRQALLLGCWALLATLAPLAQAESGGDAVDLRLERNDDGLYLSAHVPVALPELAEDALDKGIPMYFVAEAQVMRDRWYWTDRQVADATRYMRLSYQPLTRRWRLSTSSTPMVDSGLGVSLGQSFEELADALSAMQRITRWKIADAAAIDPELRHTVYFRFRIDLSQLPRPLQIGAMGRSGWNMQIERSQRLEPR